MPIFRVLLLAGACALVLTSISGADGTELTGSVGPGFTISLRTAAGADVSKLDPGSYALTVDDQSTEHNFHLTGPGVNVSTDVAATGTRTFPLTLVDGTYSFVCDAHPATMAGQFTAGTPPPSNPPNPGGGGTPRPAVKLVLTVTARAVTLATPSGRKVTTLSAGPVSITVRDRSSTRGATLRGAGVAKSTTARFVGTVTWKATLVPGSLVYAGKPAIAGGKVRVS